MCAYLIEDVRVERHNCNTIIHIRILREKVKDDLYRLHCQEEEFKTISYDMIYNQLLSQAYLLYVRGVFELDQHHKAQLLTESYSLFQCWYSLILKLYSGCTCRHCAKLIRIPTRLNRKLFFNYLC